MVDVLAQGICTITPLNPSNLSATGGALPNGTMNVMIQCNCTNDDGTVVGKVRWYDPAEIRLVAPGHGRFDANTPHFTRVNDDSDTHVVLIIPIFTDSYDGIYTCGKRVNKNLPPPPNAAVYLTIKGE